MSKLATIYCYGSATIPKDEALFPEVARSLPLALMSGNEKSFQILDSGILTD